MGDAQSKDAEQAPAHGAPEGAGEDGRTDSQRGFGASYKSERRREDFALFAVQVGGGPLKYMDVRPHHLVPVAGDSVQYEMFFEGDLAALEAAEAETLKQTVAAALQPYGGTVAGELRECGCMISMIAVPFSITENDAMTKLGPAMFEDWEELVAKEKTEAVPPASHNKAATKAEEEHSDQTPSQRAFGESYKSDLRRQDCPFFKMQDKGEELKYMDVRPHHTQPTDGDMLQYEVFFGGELSEIDADAFKRGVGTFLAEFDAVISGELRECGCMIAMVAVPFKITEENAMKLGHAMFEDFGNVQPKKPKTEQHHQQKEAPASHQPKAIDYTASQCAFADSYKSKNRRPEFPLFEITINGETYKYMDTRPHQEQPRTGDLLHYEMFWGGELVGLNTSKFKRRVASVLSDYDGLVSGDMRECGCAISMIAVPFQISELNARRLGHAMFADFGNIPDEDEEGSERRGE